MSEIHFVNADGSRFSTSFGFVGLTNLRASRTEDTEDGDGAVVLTALDPLPNYFPVVQSIRTRPPENGSPPFTLVISSSLGMPGLVMRPGGAVELGFYDRVNKTGDGVAFNGAGARPPVLLLGDWNDPADRAKMAERVVLHAILIGLADASAVVNLPPSA
jgi:hypothetical protein